MELLEDRQRPVSLEVVDRGHAGGVRDPLRSGDEFELLTDRRLGDLDTPGRVFGQDAGRLAGRVTFDQAIHGIGRLPRDAGQRERARGQPERVVIVGPERDWAVAQRLVEDRPVRPRAVEETIEPPTGADQPAVAGVRRHRLRTCAGRLAGVESGESLLDRPGSEVHVCVDEPGHHHAPSEIDPFRRHLRRVAFPGLHALRDSPVARDGQRAEARQGGVERVDRAALDDHAGSVSGVGDPAVGSDP